MNLVTSMRNIGKKFSLASVAALVVGGSALAAAGGSADPTFDDVLAQVNDWATGSLGRLLAISAFLVGMGIGLLKQSAIAVIVGLAFAIILAYGPGVIGGIFTFAM